MNNLCVLSEGQKADRPILPFEENQQTIGLNTGSYCFLVTGDALSSEKKKIKGSNFNE